MLWSALCIKAHNLKPLSPSKCRFAVITVRRTQRSGTATSSRCGRLMFSTILSDVDWKVCSRKKHLLWSIIKVLQDRNSQRGLIISALLYFTIRHYAWQIEKLDEMEGEQFSIELLLTANWTDICFLFCASVVIFQLPLRGGDNPALCCHLNRMFVRIPAVCIRVMLPSDLPPSRTITLFMMSPASFFPTPTRQPPEERTGCSFSSVIDCNVITSSQTPNR